MKDAIRFKDFEIGMKVTTLESIGRFFDRSYMGKILTVIAIDRPYIGVATEDGHKSSFSTREMAFKKLSPEYITAMTTTLQPAEPKLPIQEQDESEESSVENAIESQNPEDTIT